jgi:hypothetical protein
MGHVPIAHWEAAVADKGGSGPKNGLPTFCQVLPYPSKQLRSELKQVGSQSLDGVSWIVSWRCVVVQTAVLAPIRLIRLDALEHGNQDSEEAVGNTAEARPSLWPFWRSRAS